MEPRKPGVIDQIAFLSWFDSYTCKTALCVDEFQNERVGWFFAKICYRTFLHDAASIHEHNFVAEINRPPISRE